MTADSPPSLDDDSPAVVSLAHVAAGVNAVPGSLHWGPLDLIAYGAGPSVFLYDQGRGRVRASMVPSDGKEARGGDSGSPPSPSGRVCCVRWKGPEAMRAGGSCWAELASGTSDGVVATWRVRLLPPAAAAVVALDPEESSSCPSSSSPSSPSSPSSSCCDLRWEQTALLRLESGAGVTSLAWHEEEAEEEGEREGEEEEGEGKGKAAKRRKSTLVALAGTEAAVFSRRACSSSSSAAAAPPSPWVPCQRLSIHPRLAHAVALSVLGSEEEERKERLLLAVGTVDGATLLFLGAGGASRSRTSSCSSSAAAAAVFSPLPAAAARGHGDWVRGVAFTSKGSSCSSSCSSRKKEEEESKKTTESGASSSFSSSSSSSLLMATASNDRTVRVWEVSSSSSSSPSSGSGGGGGQGGENLDGDDDDDITALAASSSKPASSSSSSSSFSVSVRLVATLTGHDDWVLSVDWKRRGNKGGKGREPPCLLSVSADRSARLWSPAGADAAADGNGNGSGGGGGSDDGLWLCDAVVGDAGSAAALGFCGGCFSPDGDGLAAAGPAGAIHVWRREREQGGGEEEQGPSLSSLSLSRPGPPQPRSPPRSRRRLPRRWEARPSAGGHCSRIVDACWAGPDGASVLSVSEDQTARLSTWLDAKKQKEFSDNPKISSPNPASKTERPDPALWAEVARPQTHGHDFSCVAAVLSEEGLKGSASSSSSAAVYASGSEEKVIRVFEAPHAFSQTLAWARGEAGSAAAAAAAAVAGAAAFGATLPALGLSNRAVHREERGGGVGGRRGEDAEKEREEQEREEEQEEEDAAASYPEGPDALPAASPAPLASRPVEAALAGGTLWPEDVKLYGHGAELSALAATAGASGGAGGRGGGGAIGPLFASAAAAKAARWAAIRLWRKQQEEKGGEGGAAAGLSSWVAAGGQPRECHSLTVTRLAFRESSGASIPPSSSSSSSSSSPDLPPPPLLLASASRDRSFAVHSVVAAVAGEGGGAGPAEALSLETLVHVRGAHSRALTDCAWAPSPPPGPSPSSCSSSCSSSSSAAAAAAAAAAFLATSSRDGSVKVWSLSLPGPPPGSGTAAAAAGAAAAAELLLELPKARSGATALAFSPRLGGGDVSSSPCSRSARSATLAVGLGDGGVQLWAVELPLGGGGGAGGAGAGAVGAEGAGGAAAGSAPPSLSRPLWSAPAAQRHAAAVRRLCFAPEWARLPPDRKLGSGRGGGSEGGGGEEESGASSSSWLASVGDDGAVRVFRCRC